MSHLGLVLATAVPATLPPSTALPAHPGLWENLEFQLVGLCIVMGALFGLYLLCAAIGRLFQLAGKQAAARAGRRDVADAALSAGTVPHEHLAVIAAAIAGFVDEPHRLIEISPTPDGWSAEGRRQQLASHQTRR